MDLLSRTTVQAFSLCLAFCASLTAQQDTVVFDLSSDAGTVDHKGSGMLAGAMRSRPIDRYIEGAKFSYFRASTTDLIPGLDPFGLYDRLAGLGVEKQLFILGAYVRYTGYSLSDPDNWRSYWVDQISAAVARAESEGKNFEWEVFNEPDLKFAPATPAPFTFVDEADWFDVWDEAVVAVRSVKPGAIIHGPSYSSYDEAQLKRFIDHCAEAGTMPDVINWHFGTIAAYATNAATVRAYAAAKGYAVQVVIGEAIGSGTDRNLDSGLPVSLFANAERAGIHTIHACWSSARVAGVNQGLAPQLAGLLTRDSLKPRGVWWTYQAYGEMSGRMMNAAFSSSAVVDALASRDGAAAKVVALVGAKDTTGRAVRLRFSQVTGASYLQGTNGLVRAKVERVPATETEVTALPVLLEGDFVVSGGGNIEIPFVVENREAVKVTLSPGGTRPDWGEVYEAESLPATVSEGDTHAQFADSLASGGSIGRGVFSSVGGYVEYTVAIAAPGTYQLNVGSKGDTSRGKARVSVSGADVGRELDFYAASGCYAEYPLGPVTFPAAGNYVFRLTVTGKNDNSTGYRLGIDYFRLTCISNQETETLAMSVSSGDGLTVVNDASASGGQFSFANLDAVGDWVDVALEVPAAGTYALTGAMKRFSNRGQFRLVVLGGQRGAVVDGFGATAYSAIDFGTVTFPSAGWYTARAEVVGKTSGSTGYTIGLDYLCLTPARIETVHEAEDLGGSLPGGGALSTVSFVNATGGSYRKATLGGTGASLQFGLPVAESGNYLVWVRLVYNVDGARVQMQLDGVPVFGLVDTYNETNGYVNEIPLGVFSLSEGTHVLGLEVAGKNAASSGYNVSADAIRLTRVEEVFSFEAESLSAAITAGRAHGAIMASGASGGLFDQADLQGVGEWVEYVLPSMPAGTYNVNIGLKTDPAFGRVQVQFNGEGLDVTRDGYSSSGYFIGESSERGNYNSQPVTAGGPQTVRFVVTAKNAASSGYGVGVDYLRFSKIREE